MRIDKAITLDLSNKHPIENIRFHQGDENSIRLKITLTQNNEVVDTSALSVLYSATINNYLVESDAKGTATGSAIYIPITKNMSALSGELNIEIKLIETDENDTTQILYTRNLKAQVERSIVNGNLVIDFSGLTLVDLINSKLDDANGVVTTSHLKDSSITTAKLATYAVTSAKIGSGAVSTVKLSSKAVTTEKMADGAVTTDKIADEAVTTEKLAEWAVTADKIENECIDPMKLDPALYDEIAAKANFINLGTISSWDSITNGTFKSGNLYYVSTFVGSMATQIDYGNCLGFCSQDDNSLFFMNTNTSMWWLIKRAEQTFTKLTNAGISAIADNAVTSGKIADGSINRNELFSAEMLSTYLHLPLKQVTAMEFTTASYNILTTPGIYQMDTNTGTHQVVIVLRPNSDSYLMQIRLSYNNIEYRGIWCTTEGVYAEDDWENWTSLLSTAENVHLTDSGNNYYSDNLEGALLEIAQRIGKKADCESGEITSDNVAWYTNDSNLTITGEYQLIGDYCILTAIADKVDGWKVVYYSLPVACVKGSSTTVCVDTVNYIINTTTLSNISTLQIQRLDGELMSTADTEYITFTIMYKYR